MERVFCVIQVAPNYNHEGPYKEEAQRVVSPFCPLPLQNQLQQEEVPPPSPVILRELGSWGH